MEQPTSQISEAQKDEGKLTGSGISLLVGDATLATNAVRKVIKGKPEQKWTAVTMLGWAMGGIAPAFFGRTPADRAARIEAHKLDTFLSEQGIEIPRTVRDANPLLASKGLGDAMLQAVYTYPSELLNGVFAVFSLGTIYSGLAAMRKGDGVNASQLWGGISVLTGALGGIFIKEEPDAAEKARNGNPIEKAVAWIKEKPLRFSGLAYMVNDGFLAHQAFKEFKAKDNSYLLTGTAVGAYGWANVQLLSSSRDTTKTTVLRPQDREQLQGLAAEIVAAQPKHLKDKTYTIIRDYLTKERDVDDLGDFRQKFDEQVANAAQRRIDSAAERGWRTRHEAQKRAQENREQQLAK